MAFASWYSLKKAFPDCSVVVGVRLDKPLFRWASVFGALGRGNVPDVSFPPTVVAVRDFEGDWEPSPSKSESQRCLVDYSGGCGNFVVDEWINTSRVPFHMAVKRFGTVGMTANELAVLGLWERCNDLYRSVGV